MQTMYRIAAPLAVLLAIGSSVSVLRSQQRESGQEQIGRGQYLVEEVAKCTECHTPRDENHQLERDRWLQGASIWIEPVYPTPNWAEFAPALAGLPSFTDGQMERVLERGEGAEGTPLQPPMHTYHLSHADAQAIIAYLRSLPAARVQR